MAQTVSGRMLSAAFGGGTANVEFELLTGQSMSQFTPQVQTPYEQVVPKNPGYPSAVQMLVDQGHTAIALHPFSFRMYRRPQVFEDLGFSKLIDKDAMTTQERVGGGRFISDKAAFAEVQHQIDTHSGPVLMHVITMQNHMPYGKQYSDPLPPTGGLNPSATRLAGQYARGLAITDDAFNDWLDSLKGQPERTAVVFYGDHLPAQVYPSGIERREGRRVSHETPYLIWNNQEPFPHTARPTTSPNQFLPMLFEAAKAPIPPMYALLDTLREQLPAIDAGLMIGPDDEAVRRADFTPAQREALHDFRLFQYDLSIGKRYTAEEMFALPGE
jgi:phosphoglycerol transferase MdoB-like AlkP superfamily enzyme